jgi:predicted MFS family arabinose efflux permease
MLIVEYSNRVRGLARDIKLLLVCIMLFNLAIMGIYPVLFNLYLLRLAYDPEAIGFVNGMYALASAVIALPAGFVSERFGCRRVMICGGVVMIVGVFGSVFGGFVGGSLAVVSASGFLTGTGTVAFIVACTPYMIARTAAEERIFAFSIRAVIDGMFAFLGSLIGGLAPRVIAAIAGDATTNPAPFQAALSIAPVVLLCMCFILMRMGRDDDRPVRDPQDNVVASGDRAMATRSILLRIFLVSFVWMIARSGFGVLRSFLNVFLETGLAITPSGIGVIIGVSHLGGMAGAFLLPFLTKRYGLRQAIAFFMLCTAAGVLLIAFSSGAGIAAVGIFIGRTAFSMFFSSYLLFSQTVVPSYLRSRASGILYLAAGIGLSVAAVGGGVLIAETSFGLLFSIGAALLVVSGATLFLTKLGDSHTSTLTR